MSCLSAISSSNSALFCAGCRLGSLGGPVRVTRVVEAALFVASCRQPTKFVLSGPVPNSFAFQTPDSVDVSLSIA